MAKVVVLGGCGVVGSVAVKTLAKQDTFSEVVIADINLKRSQELAASVGKKVSAVRFDADDSSSIRAAVKGADIVLNCVGPFYKTVKHDRPAAHGGCGLQPAPGHNVRIFRFLIHSSINSYRSYCQLKTNILLFVNKMFIADSKSTSPKYP